MSTLYFNIQAIEAFDFELEEVRAEARRQTRKVKTETPEVALDRKIKRQERRDAARAKEKARVGNIGRGRGNTGRNLASNLTVAWWEDLE